LNYGEDTFVVGR